MHCRAGQVVLYIDDLMYYHPVFLVDQTITLGWIHYYMPVDLQRLLLVEDEDDIRAVTQIALKATSSFDLRMCADGEQALAILDEFQPQLIILDVMMPRMSGIELYKEIRKRPGFDQTPILFMTAKVQAGEIERYHNLGAADVIKKPFSPVTLAETIRSVWTAFGEARNNN